MLPKLKLFWFKIFLIWTIILYKETPVAVTIDDFVIPHMQTQALEMFDISLQAINFEFTYQNFRGPKYKSFNGNLSALATPTHSSPSNAANKKFSLSIF